MTKEVTKATRRRTATLKTMAEGVVRRYVGAVNGSGCGLACPIRPGTVRHSARGFWRISRIFDQTKGYPGEGPCFRGMLALLNGVRSALMGKVASRFPKAVGEAAAAEAAAVATAERKVKAAEAKAWRTRRRGEVHFLCIPAFLSVSA